MGQGASLMVYNSLTRTVEEFRPLMEDRVRVYSCGPTVYNYPHIGNLRAYVFSDTLQRALLWKGYEVEKIVNITDVGHLVADADSGDDKLEAAARASTESVYELAAATRTRSTRTSRRCGSSRRRATREPLTTSRK